MAKGWLARQIREAQREMATWPQWMRDSARFEGGLGASKVERKPPPRAPVGSK